jgi:hypothetical protein
MLKNDYLERMRPYQNDFSDSLNSVFVVRFAHPNSFILQVGGCKIVNYIG